MSSGPGGSDNLVARREIDTSSSKIIKVVVVESNTTLREALQRDLENPMFSVLASARYVHGLTICMDGELSTIILVIGISDNHEAAIRDIGFFRRTEKSGRVVVLVERSDVSNLTQLLSADVDACLPRNISRETLVQTLQLVATERSSVSLDFVSDGAAEGDRDGASRKLDTPGLGGARDVPRFSGREKEVLGCLAAGHSNKQIARRMDISESTVKVHLKAILQKIGAHNRTQAALWVARTGLTLGLIN